MVARLDFARDRPAVLDLPPRLIVHEQVDLSILEVAVAVARDGQLRAAQMGDRRRLGGRGPVPGAPKRIIVEDIEIKSTLLKRLDEVCPSDSIFASNTSSISLTKLAASSARPERVIGMHFFNPVPMMQLVEIIRALQTSDAVCERITELTRSIGNTPRISKDSYGFVVNRVLVPMVNEAINCVYEGLANPEDVDEMMKLGANHPMGPLSLGDLIGLDIVLDIMETLYSGFDDPKYRPSPLLKQMVDAGYLGRKTGRGFFRYG